MVDYPWIASYPKEIDWNHPIDSKPLYTILDDAAIKFAENNAIDFLGKIYSYRQLYNLVNRAANGFRKLGVTKGTKVGILLPNCPQFVISYFGILKAGGTVVNFSPLYAVEELRHQLENSQTEILITINLQAIYPKVKELLGYGKLRNVIITSMSEALPFPKNLLFPLLKKKQIAQIAMDSRHIAWELLLDNSGMDKPTKIDPENDIAARQYTGGTTGVPKGAILTHKNLYANTIQCKLWFHDIMEGQERMLGVLPFFHIFAMTTVMNFSIAVGACIIMHPRFEIKKVLQDIHKKKPTLMPGVPTMYTAINNYPQLKHYNLSSLKACISGGAPLPLEVKERFEQLTGCRLIEGYGLTETSPVACANPLEGKNKTGSVGLPLPNTVIQIENMENRGKFLEAGKIGEICISGPQVMRGYFVVGNRGQSSVVSDQGTVNIGLRTEDNKLSLNPKSQILNPPSSPIPFRTGDIGYIDEDGYVFVTDRLKEMIIASGYNIYPRYVEEAIYKHEAVLEVAVVGIPDSYRGQTVKAFIALKPDHNLSAEELEIFLKDKLGRHEIPTHVEFRKELPKTMIGKISKKDL